MSRLVALLIHLFLLSLLLNHVRSTSINDTTQTINLANSACTFIFTSTHSPSSIQFHYCQQDNQYNSDWKNCFSRCCSSALAKQYDTPSIAGLNYCQKVNAQDSGTLSGLVISLIVISSLVAMALLICLYVRWSRYNQRMIHAYLSQKKGTKKIVEVRDVEWLEETEINFGKQKEILWSKQAKSTKIRKVTGIPCSICLDQNTTAQLFCGHQYHPKCIGDWLERNFICPCCRLQDVKGIKIYCDVCRWRYFVCTRTMLSKQGRPLPQQCDHCTKVGELVADSSLTELSEAATFDIKLKQFKPRRTMKVVKLFQQ